MLDWEGGIEEISVPSPQFCFETKTALKNKVLIKNRMKEED